MARDLTGWAERAERLAREATDSPHVVEAALLTATLDALAAVLRAVASEHRWTGGWASGWCETCEETHPCETTKAVLAALAPLAPLFPDTEGGSDG